MSATEEKPTTAAETAAPAAAVAAAVPAADATKEESKATPTETPKEEAKEETKEEAKEETKEAPKEEVKEEAKEAPKAEEAKEPTKEAPPSPLAKLAARVPELIKSTGHTEVWGVELGDVDAHVPTQIVLQKFLRANGGDATAAAQQLEKALAWRKEFQPLTLVDQVFDGGKFDGLGYATVHKDGEGKETVITWNIYGAVKSFKNTFGDVDEFIKWRAALMELGVQKLNLNEATEPLSDDDKVEDPYKMIQVHDYLSISFLRRDPHVKAATSRTIDVFSTAYPELLAHKYFVNVPVIMGWMYAVMKLVVAPATLKKFHPMSDGKSLVGELAGIEATLPKEYGGKGASVKEQGLAVALTEVPKEEDKKGKKKEDKAAAKEEVPKEETPKEEAAKEETPKEEAATKTEPLKEEEAAEDKTAEAEKKETSA